MPGMTGVEFLKETIERFPGAKRALLRAYFGTEEGPVRAIDAAGLGSKPGETRFTVRLPRSNRENGG